MISNRKQQSALIRILILVILAYFFSNVANAATIKVAVVDTGYTKGWLKTEAKLCETGHKDLTQYDERFPVDKHGHGTHISVTIGNALQRLDYCIIALKYYEATELLPNENSERLVKAIRYATDQNVDVINLSLGGTGFSLEEYVVLKKALDKGIKIVAAMGNESRNIDVEPFYPACYDSRIEMVGAITKKGSRLPASNFFKKKLGSCKNDNPQQDYGVVALKGVDGHYVTYQGTSQATAVRTGRVTKQLFYNRIDLYLTDKYYGRTLTAMELYAERKYFSK